jgi:hypothetical protein
MALGAPPQAAATRGNRPPGWVIVQGQGSRCSWRGVPISANLGTPTHEIRRIMGDFGPLIIQLSTGGRDSDYGYQTKVWAYPDLQRFSKNLALVSLALDWFSPRQGMPRDGGQAWVVFGMTRIHHHHRPATRGRSQGLNQKTWRPCPAALPGLGTASRHPGPKPQRGNEKPSSGTQCSSDSLLHLAMAIIPDFVDSLVNQFTLDKP